MATANPFDILGDDDNNEDLSQLVAAAQLKAAEKPKKVDKPAAPASQPAKLPTRPAPPAQAVREAKNEGGRGGSYGEGRGRGRGHGRGGSGGFNRDSNNNEISFTGNGFSGRSRPSEDAEAGKTSERRGYGAPRGGFRGGRRGGYSNGEDGEGDRPRRLYDRHSGTGRGNGIKREGSGRGNWGTHSDEIAPEFRETEEPVVDNEKNVITEKLQGEEDAADANKDTPETEPEEKEPEEKEMTLEEYEKVLEEKRKALLALKTEERKVGLDKDLKCMQQLSSKKSNNEIFIKLGSEKDKRKDAADKEDRAKKAVSINEFLKPAEGERSYNPGRGGRGRGRGRGGFGSNARDVAAPSIEDPGQFPTLGGK
ncbi:hypothetical protein OIU77_027514 [Salix suchowensis]|uniref:Hyaluronan/mRNA-binding protein domain-containing protein n=1 Tax=Salix suchowensis TaxID=1278906 RepID=A0ABQ9BQC8_9ROSI|nr:nuclear RNA-binding family protein [Salix suchowensis]KAJ6389185.1 hypothetical protein OIU77_027514 [Salix suchowensis]